MSRIYFHSPSDDTEVRGSERAFMSGMCSDFLIQAVNLDNTNYSFGKSKHPMWYITKDSSYCKKEDGNSERFTRILATNLAVCFNDSPIRHWDGTSLVDIDPFTLALNTALAIGSDPVKLSARIHGQCEVHGYVEGKNRAWLAGIIEQGIATGIMRETAAWKSGWTETIAFLKSRDDEPVVLSYSVCDQFPNAHTAKKAGYVLPMSKDYPDEEDSDAWYDLSDEEKWDWAMKGLRAEDAGLEFCPEHWNYPDDFYFGAAPITGFQVFSGAVAYSKICEPVGDVRV